MDVRLRLLGAFVLALSLGGCELVGDIFEAGVWVGVVVTVLVLVLVVWAVLQLFD